MFVTSDIFDLKRIGRFRRTEWSENLVAGISVHGTAWRGYQAGARFLLEAARYCGLEAQMEWAGYSRPGDRRTQSIKPKSLERLIRSELAGARRADSVLLRGLYPAKGDPSEAVVGGRASGDARTVGTVSGSQLVENYPFDAFDADFLFPVTADPVDTASGLLRLAVDLLGAEYGYYFVRDEFCFPMIYTGDGGPALDHGPLCIEDSVESSNWRRFVSSGRLWTEKWPPFRDLFQANLVSERHLSVPIEGLGYLDEWIAAQPGRGRLEDLGQGRLLWILTDQEIFDVRPVLNEAGVLFSCRERVYRDLPGGAADAQRMYDEQARHWAPWVSNALLDYPGRFSRAPAQNA